eukprot:CAMPEP_0172310202 /NCGR_PEP_ID=MMETSP1058-20130122/11349_1 /TAXON_ID=83371 /ORGANISM="Detonula confervacea, Strain CCMP 353" /LENGTH=178 /DNA_ID=CAMNT_0013022971 /DNA_START=320 /DNA_END=856 /DNA_ORIENTATION=+
MIDFLWTMRGNHVLKVVAHATAPMSAEPGFRQYHFLDWRSFLSFPKFYRLGLTGSKTMCLDGRGGGQHNQRQHAVNNSRSGMSGVAESLGWRKNSSIAEIEAPNLPTATEKREINLACVSVSKPHILREKAQKQSGEPLHGSIALVRIFSCCTKISDSIREIDGRWFNAIEVRGNPPE